MYEGRKYYKYSCCTSGRNEGEMCGECCEEGSLAGLVVLLIIIIVGSLAGTGIGLACCWSQKCCCFAETLPPPQPVGYGGYQGSYGQPVSATVVGQPVVAQADATKATVVVAPGYTPPSNEKNPNLT